jgi:hypothetical protein
MSKPGWVLGYHGCDAALGEAVLRGDKVLLPSENDYDWLGTGIYFWENDPKRALDWAQTARRNPRVSKSRVEEPFALGAIIDLGSCLDLTESASLDKLRKAHEIFSAQDRLKVVNEGTTDNPGRRKLDCAVVNFLHDLLEEAGEEPFDSVRALFPEGGPLFPNSGILERTHIQLSLRRERSIVAYFRPRFERL